MENSSPAKQNLILSNAHCRKIINPFSQLVETFWCLKHSHETLIYRCITVVCFTLYKSTYEFSQSLAGLQNLWMSPIFLKATLAFSELSSAPRFERRKVGYKKSRLCYFRLGTKRVRSADSLLIPTPVTCLPMWQVIYFGFSNWRSEIWQSLFLNLIRPFCVFPVINTDNG